MSVSRDKAGGKKAIIGVCSRESSGRSETRVRESGQPLTYGKSITDACTGWEDTDALLRQLSAAVKARRG